MHLDLSIRLHIDIDPGVLLKFTTSMSLAPKASLANPRTGRLHNYLGLGKSTGDVVRSGKDDDQSPINEAVQSALNDLFGKLEHNPRLHRDRSARLITPNGLPGDGPAHARPTPSSHHRSDERRATDQESS